LEKKKKEKRLLSETKRYITEGACPDCGGDVITTVEIVHSEPSTGSEHVQCSACKKPIHNKMVS